MKDPEEVRERVSRRLQTEALEAAVDGLTRVLKDPKSPAPAVATAGVAVLRANGMLTKEEGKDGKDLHEMSLAELRAEMDRAQRNMRAAQAAAEAAEERGNVFG